MLKLLELLLHFFADVFFKNEEVRNTVKSPGFFLKLIMGGVVMFCTFAYLLNTFQSIAGEEHNRFDDVSRDYRELEQAYREAVGRRNELAQLNREKRKELFEVQRELALKEQAAQDLNDRLQEVVDKNEAGECVYMGGGWRSSVNSLLDTLDADHTEKRTP